MIVIGSCALALLGLKPWSAVKDFDFIGDEADVDRFRTTHRAIIERESLEHDHIQVFFLKDGQPVQKVEIDIEQSPSNRMLAELCPRQGTVMDLPVAVPSVEALYLIKRSHANVPVVYNKAVADLIVLKPLIGAFSARQEEFYAARKEETRQRYALHRQRFSLALKNEDFFDASNHVRFYEHDDLHEVVAHTPGAPLYKKCKRDLSRAKIDIDLFEALSLEDRYRMVQEEFMVIGLERFFIHNRDLALREVYAHGMHKTIRDLFVGYFQDFCIDHVGALSRPPPFDFVARFVKAEQAGELRRVEIKVEPPGPKHKQIWKLINAGELDEARGLAEDLLRRADHGIDSHASFLLGITLFRSNRLRNAERCFRQCVSRDRKHGMAWFYLGTTLLRMGRHADAVAPLRQAVAENVKSDDVFFNLGLVHEALGEVGHAIAAYRCAGQIKPGDSEIAGKLAALGAPAS
jgi:tetratricopeptide (TPR) repeat protein